LNKLGRHPLEDIHASYLSSSYLGFLKEDFLSFHYIHIGKTMIPGAGPILTLELLFKQTW
jgi:hypothetical protein